MDNSIVHKPLGRTLEMPKRVIVAVSPISFYGSQGEDAALFRFMFPVNGQIENVACYVESEIGKVAGMMLVKVVSLTGSDASASVGVKGGWNAIVDQFGVLAGDRMEVVGFDKDTKIWLTMSFRPSEAQNA